MIIHDNNTARQEASLYGSISPKKIMKGAYTVIYGYISKDAHYSTSNRWAAGRYNANNAWNYNSNGICNNNNFYNRLMVSAVARIHLIRYLYGKARRLENSVSFSPCQQT